MHYLNFDINEIIYAFSVDFEVVDADFSIMSFTISQKDISWKRR